MPKKRDKEYEQNKLGLTYHNIARPARNKSKEAKLLVSGKYCRLLCDINKDMDKIFKKG